jgi:hypothetical protein
MSSIVPLKEMTLYWTLVRKDSFSNKRVNRLILVLEFTKSHTAYVILESLEKLDDHSLLIITEEEIKISGLVPQNAALLLEDYLTSSSEVIRDYAIAFLKKKQQL